MPFSYLSCSCRYQLAMRLVVRISDPKPVQHNRQFPRDGDHRSLLTVLTSALRQFESKAA
jgi:hypothetical protein